MISEVQVHLALGTGCCPPAAGTVTVTVGLSGGVPQAVTQCQADRHGVTGPTARVAAPFRVRGGGGGWHSVTGKPEFKFKLGPGVQLVDNYARNPVIP